MTEIQYLQLRIKDLEKGLLDPDITHKERKNHARALVNYRLDLKRALENRKSNQMY